MDRAALEQIYNHVFLPVKLPQKEDEELVLSEVLTREIESALQSFIKLSSSTSQDRLRICLRAVRDIRAVTTQSGGFDASNLDTLLAQLSQYQSNRVLPLYVAAQNCGLLLRSGADEKVVFESFELAATSEAVMGTKGRLKRIFPGCAVEVNKTLLADHNFRRPLVEALEKLRMETPSAVMPTSIKAGSKVLEARDTVHPTMITEMLTAMLLAVGEVNQPLQFRKNIREDILWKDCRQPWRRSPYWLFLRILLQGCLLDPNIGEQHSTDYKMFMVLFMSQILEKASDANCSPEMLHQMSAKIVRRLVKINPNGDETWLRGVQCVLDAANVKMNSWWSDLQSMPTPRSNFSSKKLTSSTDTALKMTSLRKYLDTVWTRTENISEAQINLPTGSKLSFTGFPSISGPDIPIWLQSVESWSKDRLVDWSNSQTDHEHTVKLLSSLLHSYHTTGAHLRTENPAAYSIWILTIMEIWLQIDRHVIMMIPLLANYQTGFRRGLFDPLLLPQLQELRRMAAVESYVSDRNQKARYTIQDLLNGEGSLNSFAVRFFDQSTHHQNLLRRVEADARTAREMKRKELAKCKEKYNSLVNQSKSCNHDYVLITTIYGGQENRHLGSCVKCDLENQAAIMEIGVHEWPLPAKLNAVKVAIFEIDIPVEIASWRDVTLSLLIDTFSSLEHNQGRERIYQLQDAVGLEPFILSEPSRIHLGSKAKPFHVSHYRVQKVSVATETGRTGVCVPQGMAFSMYDRMSMLQISDLLDSFNIRDHCLMILPQGPLHDLQYAVSGTTHTTNQTIAQQAQCHHSLTQHEYYSFAAVRAGSRIQLLNVARELKARGLNFNKEETFALIVQTIWEAGTAEQDKLYRDAHVPLKNMFFTSDILQAVEEVISDYEANWQGAAALRTMTYIVRRTLSMTSSEEIRNKCYFLLRKMRNIFLGWARHLDKRFVECQDEEKRAQTGRHVYEMALSCHATFDVDIHLLNNLIGSDEDLTDLLESMIASNMRRSPQQDHLSLSLSMFLYRWRYFNQEQESFVRNAILKRPEVLHAAILKVWPNCQAVHPWAMACGHSDRWVTTKTIANPGDDPLELCYNVLDGLLLVNGSPLSRLPKEFEQHSTFRRLLGNKMIDVVPSSMKGMRFQGRCSIIEHELHFQMIGGELIIRARHFNKTMELLPMCILAGDFPHHYIHDYFHWLNLDSRQVDWRPKAQPWVACTDGWTLRESAGSYHLEQSNRRLIDIHSPTAMAIHQLYQGLDIATFTHAYLHSDTDLTEVDLPRLRLSFTAQKNQSVFHSKQFVGMYVDDTQHLGTLTGLDSMLVLTDAYQNQVMLVPHGKIIFSQTGNNHVRVNIETSSSDCRLTFYTYHVDSVLGELKDNGGFKSKVYKAYLHAVTSHCLPDTLTGISGSESAITILSSPSLLSFKSLDEADLELLDHIVRLTPQRQFYPQNLKVMQQVEWLDLPSLSQKGDFLQLVYSIIGHYRELQLLGVDHPNTPHRHVKNNNLFLLERSVDREAALRLGQSADPSLSNCHDVNYGARDLSCNDPRFRRIQEVARAAATWTTALIPRHDLLNVFENQRREISGSSVREKSLGYDPDWLVDNTASILPDRWLGLYHWLTNTTPERHCYELMFFSSALAYKEGANQKLIETLIALATVPAVRGLRRPFWSTLNLSHGYKPNRGSLIGVLENFKLDFWSSPAASLGRKAKESDKAYRKRVSPDYQQKVTQQVGTLADNLVSQGLTTSPSIPTSFHEWSYLKRNGMLYAVQPLFTGWVENDYFRLHVSQIQQKLNTLEPASRSNQTLPLYDSTRLMATRRPSSLMHLDLISIMKFGESFGHGVERRSLTSLASRKSVARAVDTTRLESLIGRLSQDSLETYEKGYVDNLQTSINALTSSHRDYAVNADVSSIKDETETHLTHCRTIIDDWAKAVYHSLSQKLSYGPNLALRLGMGPRISRKSLLQTLSHKTRHLITKEWKLHLLGFALALLDTQHAFRLRAASSSTAHLSMELSNMSVRNWDPLDHIDWLLLELDSNIKIREVQVQVARMMIAPLQGKNSVMQLNMGEGKSSVITPMVICDLADKSRLVRLVVLKQLSTQMTQVLIDKLGGLVNRQVFHLPFSRSLRLDVSQVKTIEKLMNRCMTTGGVILAHPEHISSFELLGIDYLLSDDDPSVGGSILQLQNWLKQNCRDVLDESDEILSVRYELVYTMGLQRGIDLQPNRWLLIESVLELSVDAANLMAQKHSNGLEIGACSTGQFPRLRVLDLATGKELLVEIAKRICDGGISDVPIWRMPEQVQKKIFIFLTQTEVGDEDVSLIKTYANVSLFNSLILLRGLLCCNVLLFTLHGKRCRVNYGLDPTRTTLAVPYRAKDQPSPRSEFSHPDVTIILTSLSYYYSGLTEAQLLTTFQTLLRSSQPDDTFARWIKDLDTPFIRLSGVNIQDLHQFRTEVFPHLRLVKVVIDFYMNHHVFPYDMKEFPEKLSASGWNLAREKYHTTTGFSGTNDSRALLPLTISQNDLPSQLHTNAAVLNHLMKPQNSVMSIPENGSNDSASETILKVVSMAQPAIRVLIDVGAQMLDMTNEEVAKHWLTLTAEVEVSAAVFFDDDDNKMVIDRRGMVEHLLQSQFNKQLDKCVIYMDEVHTRGTDFQLPPEYRAAVTLAAGLSKDRLVQACMRMRKLAQDQTITFLASSEVQHHICAGLKLEARHEIDLVNVVRWTIGETWHYFERAMPLWAVQGFRYQQHENVWDHMGTESWTRPRAQLLLEPEAKTVSERYDRKTNKADYGTGNGVELQLHHQSQIRRIQEKCEMFRCTSFDSAALEEEQERELAPEQEEERQIEPPRALSPLNHTLHEDVRLFAQTGRLTTTSPAFSLAFTTLSQTSAGRNVRSKFGDWPGEVFVTRDFSQTVAQTAFQDMDDYLRPVHWIIYCPGTKTIAIVSPFEANKLLPVFNKSQSVHLCIYAPRTCTSMNSLESLLYCCTPPVLGTSLNISPIATNCLNIFAGQLYFATYNDYAMTCQLLGLCYEIIGENVHVSSDGFVKIEHRKLVSSWMDQHCHLKSSPVEIVKKFIAMRRKGEDFRMTHLGNMLAGGLITKGDF